MIVTSNHIIKKEPLFRELLDNHSVMLYCFLGKEILRKSPCAIQTRLNFTFVFNVAVKCNSVPDSDFYEFVVNL